MTYEVLEAIFLPCSHIAIGLTIELLDEVEHSVVLHELVRYLRAQKHAVVVAIHGDLVAVRDFQMVVAHHVQVGEVEVGAIAAELNQVAVVETSDKNVSLKLSKYLCSVIRLRSN